MKLKIPYGEAPLAVVLFAAFFGKYYFDDKQVVPDRIPPRVTRASAEFQALSLKKYHFGFQNVLADMLWVQLLQQASHAQLNRDEVSWEYAQLNGITSLDPKFRRAYPFGAAYLSVFRRDRLGAQLILEKWTRMEPISWRAHYVLGYHYFFEQKKYQDASRAILRAASLEGAPSWLSALGVRLISETGSHLTALQVALDLYPSITNIEGKYRLRKRIRAIRYALLKTAWQNSLKQYTGQRRPASTQELVPMVQKELNDLGVLIAQLSIHEDLEPLFVEQFQFQYNPASHKIELVHNMSPTELLELEESGIHHNKQGVGK